MSGLLALKLLLVPSLIVAITLAGKRWGAGIAGCLAGFPVVTGPILFFLALEQGAPFARKAAIAATVAVLGNIAFGIAYSWVAQKRAWLASFAVALVVYFCVVAILNIFSLPAWQAAVMAIMGLLIAAKLYPRDLAGEGAVVLPKSDLPYRVVAALALVFSVTFFSAELGANLAGLFAVFPVMASVLAVFSHRNIGQRFAVRLLRGMVRGFYSFIAFCFILASVLGTQSIVVTFLLALAAAIVVQTFLMHFYAKKDKLLAQARVRAGLQ
jgi:hypothetical protein